jgi:pilus assembly protein CpaE
MNRQALIIGSAVEPESGLEQTLQRYGYSGAQRVPTAAAALEQMGQESVDLVFVPIDAIDDADLAAVERAGRRDRHLGIIATGPKPDPELMLRAMRAGIQEFLVRPVSLTDFVSAVERLHRRAEVATATGQIYAIFSSKGGVGATTTAVNLASSLAANHAAARVAVADLTLPGGDVGILLNVRPSYDLGDLAEKIERLDAELLNSVLAPAADGVWVLAAPDRAEMADAVDANAITSVIGQLRASFNFSVLDCEHQLNDRTLAALDGADRILLLTELKVPALRAAQRTIGIFRRLGYPNEKLCVVVNRYQSGDVVSLTEASQVLKADIFFKLPNDYRIVSDAATAGVPVTDRHPDSKLAWGYLQLAHKLGGGTMPSASDREGDNGSRSRIRQLFTRKRS